MKIYKEESLSNFEWWSGAVATADRIWEERGTEGWNELEAILEDAYPDGMDETELNDLLWFEPETIFEWLGIGDEENENEEEEETEPTNDYVINVGDSWDDLTPQQTFSTEQAAISTAKALPDKCVEVVYSPCDASTPMKLFGVIKITKGGLYANY